MNLKDMIEMLHALKSGVLRIQSGLDEILPRVTKLEELIRERMKNENREG